MKKQILYVFKEVLEEAKVGFFQKSTTYSPKTKQLSSEAYEKNPIIYKARPIPQGINKK